MLIYLRICNFKSIVETTIDMRYGEGKAPNGYKDMERMPFLEYPVGKGKNLRLSPVMAIYGQNAGGKTTLVEAMNTLRRCVFEDKLHYQPNKLHRNLEDTTFEIGFAYEERIFSYKLIYNQIGVQIESLKTHLQDIYFIDHNRGLYHYEGLATETYTHEPA